MTHVEDLTAQLRTEVEARRTADENITRLRAAIRGMCEHPIVVQGYRRPGTWGEWRMCLTCGVAEYVSALRYHRLAKPLKLVETDARTPPRPDSPDVHMQFFAWCKDGHDVATPILPYGWCEEHMPPEVRKQRERSDAEEARINSPG